MPPRKGSIWRRPAVKKKATVKKPLGKQDKQKKPQSREAILKNCITQTSQLAMHIQNLLDESFVLAPNQLRGYLMRADAEIRDLLRLLTSKIGVTPDVDVLEVDYFQEDVSKKPDEFAGTLGPVTASAQPRSRNRDLIAMTASALLADLTESDVANEFDPSIRALAGIAKGFGNNETETVVDRFTKRWNRHFRACTRGGVKSSFLDAATLQRCIITALEKQDYIVWPPHDKSVDRYEVWDSIPKHQIICLRYGYADDPSFGIVGDDDGERALKISTPDGLKVINVN